MYIDRQRFSVTKRLWRSEKLLTALRLVPVAFVSLLVILVSSFVYATPPKLCISEATWSLPHWPGQYNKGPDWWSLPPYTGDSVTDREIERLAFSYSKDFRRTDDPRWRGALNIAHDKGGTENAEFRALYHTDTDTGERYLLLSFAVKSISDFNLGYTSVFVGLKSPSANPSVVRIGIQQDDTTVGGEVKPRASSEGGVAYLSFSTFVHQGSNWVDAPGGDPIWVSDKTRLWAMPAAGTNNPAFTVQMRVPLDSSPLNLNLTGNTFSMWYSMQPSLPINGDPGLTSFTWPREESTAGEFTYYEEWTTAGLRKHIPDHNTWGEFGLKEESDCAGVTLAKDDIGIINSSIEQEILIDETNIFYVLPKNSSTQNLDMSQIKATFYFANWGSQRGVLTPESWTTLTDHLIQVPVDATYAPQINDPNVVTSNLNQVPQNKKVPIANDWSLVKEEKCKFFVEGQPSQYLAGNAYCSGLPAPTLNPHACMLVKLEANNLEFLNDSVWKNIDVVKASKIERDAEISVVGLPPHPLGTRDVYLFIDRRNMPAIQRETPKRKDSSSVGKEKTHSRGQLAKIHAMLARGVLPQLSYEQLATIMPTFVVHAFNDTGKKIFIDGTEHKLLEQQTSFGHFAWHEGTVKGWVGLLMGAEKDPETGVFKVSVPNNGVATIKTYIEAIQPRGFRRCFEWLSGR